MRHEDFQEMISFYIDDALSEKEKDEFEAHLGTCEECREELRMTQLLLCELGDLEELDLPVGFEEEMEMKLAAANAEMGKTAPEKKGSTAGEKRKKKGPFSWRFAYSTAAALMLLIAGTAYYNSQYHLLDEVALKAAPTVGVINETQVPQASPEAATYSVAMDGTAEGTTAGSASPTDVVPTAAIVENGNYGDGQTKDATISGNSGKTTKNAGDKRRKTTPTPTPGNTEMMMKSMSPAVEKVEFIATGSPETYMAWAEKKLQEMSGIYVPDLSTDTKKVYLVKAEQYGEVLDLLGNIELVRGETGDSGVLADLNDVSVDQSEAVKKLEEKIAEGGTDAEAATTELAVLRDKLQYATIIITKQN